MIWVVILIVLIHLASKIYWLNCKVYLGTYTPKVIKSPWVWTPTCRRRSWRIKTCSTVRCRRATCRQSWTAFPVIRTWISIRTLLNFRRSSGRDFCRPSSFSRQTATFCPVSWRGHALSLSVRWCVFVDQFDSSCCNLRLGFTWVNCTKRRLCPKPPMWPYWRIFVCKWGKFYCCKWPNIEGII